MSTILHSQEVQLRKRTVMVPPITMYHLRKLLALKDEGVNFDSPDGESLTKILQLILEVVQENHPELTYEEFEKEIDASNIKDLMAAVNSLPKNSTALTGETAQKAETDQS